MFGKAREKWLTELLSLENEIPSHDTFGKVFSVIDTQLFSECFSRWVSSLVELSDENIIAIEGKCHWRSIDKGSNKSALYMFSA